MVYGKKSVGLVWKPSWNQEQSKTGLLGTAAVVLIRHRDGVRGGVRAGGADRPWVLRKGVPGAARERGGTRDQGTY